MSGYALVKWIEEPPKWDVIHVRDIRCEGDLEAGAHVEAKFEEDMFPAIVVQLGTQTSLNKAVLAIVDEQPVESTRSASPTRACKVRKKKTAAAVNDKIMSQKAAIRNNERLRSKALLDAVEAQDTARNPSKVCTLCKDKDETIAWQREQIKHLHASLNASPSINTSVQRFEDAVVWLEEIKSDITTNIKTTASEAASVIASAPVPARAPARSPARAPAPAPAPARAPAPAPAPARAPAPAPAPAPTPAQAPAPATPSVCASTPTTSRTLNGVTTPSSRADRTPLRPPAPTPPAAHAHGSSIVGDMAIIGPCTAIPAIRYQAINWRDKGASVRELFVAVFTRDVLATSSLTGKLGNANPRTSVPKPALDRVKLLETQKFLVDKLVMKKGQVRAILRAKLNDEAKAFKNRMAPPAPPVGVQVADGGVEMADGGVEVADSGVEVTDSGVGDVDDFDVNEMF